MLLPVVPAAALDLPALPAALLDLPAVPVEFAEPPLLERVPALPVGCELESMLLPRGGSLQAIATPTNNVAKPAIVLERLRMFTSLHRRATVNDIDAPRALALDAVASVAC